MKENEDITFLGTFTGKLILLLMLMFGGSFLSTWIAPKAIAWYFDPPVDIGVNCRQATEWAMNALLRAQLWGLVLGCIVGIIIIFSKTRKKPKVS